MFILIWVIPTHVGNLTLVLERDTASWLSLMAMLLTVMKVDLPIVSAVECPTHSTSPGTLISCLATKGYPYLKSEKR